MAITSIALAGIDIFDGTDYAAGAEMAYALEAMEEYAPIAVEMADRHPFYVREQIQAKPIPVIIFLLGQTLSAREAAYVALANALRTSGLKELTWNNGGDRTLDVRVNTLNPSAYYTRVIGEAVAFNPIPR